VESTFPSRRAKVENYPMSDAEKKRRAYWTEQLELAHDFMQQVLAVPVEECGEKMLDLRRAVQERGVRVEFSAKKHALGLDRIYRLRAGLVEGFLAACAEMNARGWVMKVEDGFRSRQMQKHVGRQPSVFDAILKTLIWELDGQKPSPEFFLRRSLALVALRPKTGTHMSGSAIDISVFDAATGLEVERGAPYLEMSHLTPMLSPFVSASAQKNRVEITAIMRRHGLVEYPYEFWHYNGGDVYESLLLNTGKPARYGAIDWNPADDSVRPIPNSEEPLNSPEEIRAEIDHALRRMPR
jgi:zinc D-Ala-D-Ala dipeptidase